MINSCNSNVALNFTFQIVLRYQCLSSLNQLWRDLLHAMLGVACLYRDGGLHCRAIICKSFNSS
jgi:hypothetical protein